ncbi:hypothetical protein ACOMHN_048386 [Nucella lapillus]
MVQPGTFGLTHHSTSESGEALLLTTRDGSANISGLSLRGRVRQRQLLAFCRLTPMVRHHLARNLPLLRQAVASAMSEDERWEVEPYIDNPSRFSADENIFGLALGLGESLTNLRCIGRALDIHCPRFAHGHLRLGCLRRYGFAKFQRHILPGNAQRLQSQTSFQNIYQDVRQDFQQLAAALALNVPTGGQAAGSCDEWAPAKVLTGSYVTISTARSLLTNVNSYCQDMGNSGTGEQRHGGTAARRHSGTGKQRHGGTAALGNSGTGGTAARGNSGTGEQRHGGTAALGNSGTGEQRHGGTAARGNSGTGGTAARGEQRHGGNSGTGGTASRRNME